MFEYNDTNIFIGYIKQLLHDFNLPNMRVYNVNKPAFSGQLYIYMGNIVRCLNTTEYDENLKRYVVNNNTFKHICKYNYNKKIYYNNDKLKDLNLTKNLKLSNNIYDSYTHKYLGNYLRFQRDYNDLNLMYLYNCFSNELVEDLYIKSTNYVFDSEDSSYKIYKIPVKLFQKYTIAIDSAFPVELVCGFYDKKQLGINNLSIMSYKKFANIKFNSPVVYDNIDDYNKFVDAGINIQDILSFINSLVLYIKVKANVKSSIVVLEGDYRNYNDFIINKNITENESGGIITASKAGGFTSHNISINNYEYKGLNNTHLISPSQLLIINSKISHPFSDRLVEYLVDNAITNQDNIGDNIKRVQSSLHNKYNITYLSDYKTFKLYKRWDDSFIAEDTSYTSQAGETLISGYISRTLEEIKKDIDDEIPETTFFKHNIKGLKDINNYGIWEKNYQNILYDVAIQNNLINIKNDILGYVDKDVERKLGADVDIYEEDK